MKLFLMIVFYHLLISGVALADENQADSHEIIVASLDDGTPSCRVRLPNRSIRCNNQECEISAPKTSSLKIVKLLFSCLPTSARTGFEDPPPDAKLFSLKTLNKIADVSLIDDPESEPGERMRHLSFCLYGNRSTFCGYAKTLRLKDGEEADASGDVLKLIKAIDFLDGVIRK